jgi:site-specific DNA-cytosine methylase
VTFKGIGRLIGNAVPVKLGYAIGKSIRRHLSQYERE